MDSLQSAETLSVRARLKKMLDLSRTEEIISLSATVSYIIHSNTTPKIATFWTLV